MLRITLENDERVIAALESKGPKIISNIQRELDILMYELLRRIQSKLSGGVLNQRTGKLLSSVVKQPTIVSGTGQQVIGGVSGAGGPAFYGQGLEKGRRAFDVYPVNKMALAFFPEGSAGAAIGFKGTRFMFTKRGNLKKSMISSGTFGAAGGVVVKHVHIPARPGTPFMSSSLDEMKAEIISRIYRAAVAAIT